MDPQTIPIKDASMILQAAATLTATNTSATYDLAQGATLVNGQYAPGGGGAPMQVIIPVTSFVGTGTYSFVLNESIDGVTFKSASRVATPTGDGLTATVGGLMSVMVQSHYRYLQLVTTIGGTSPSIVLGDCYIVPITNAFGG